MRGRMQILTRTVTVITKPQHISNWDVSNVVVYHPYSSPNHNSPFCTGCYGKVVSHPYSSPNHNIRHTLISLCLLYLILIHHQTTTRCPHSLYSRCCISSLFITKPQPKTGMDGYHTVVSHPYSSPNHNSVWIITIDNYVVSHPYSSPNHN